MYDSTSSADIPAGAEMVAGYVDGLYKWSDEDWQRHPKAVWVGIATNPNTNDGQVIDIENGDATPAQAAAWIRMRFIAGQRPGTAYFSASRFGEVNAAMIAAGISPGDWAVWVADWDGKAELPAGAYAKQYANPLTSGGHFDLSVVADYWPGVDPAASAPPPPPPPPGPPPPVPPPVPPPPEPNPPTGPPIDDTRSAWQNLASFFTSDLPAAVRELLRLLGLSQGS